MSKTTRRLSRRLPLVSAVLAVVGLIAAGWLTAADHLDSPLVAADAGADIADVYSFTSPNNPDNLVLIMTLHGFIPPSESGISLFDPDVLYQFKIDNDGDATEDLVIQAFVTGEADDQVMHFRGPAAPEVTGAMARVVRGPETATVPVSTTPSPIVASRRGMTVFAGVRDDPFFLDFGQFLAILAGEASSFNDPGMDSFAGFNVYAIAVELPMSSLGGSANLSVWGTTSR